VLDCEFCGVDATIGGLTYHCAYCGAPVCADHRLPENHECPGDLLPPGTLDVDDTPVVAYDPDRTDPAAATSSWARQHELDLSDTRLPGHTPETKHRCTDSSPDVAPDGSLVHDNTETDDSPSLLDRLLPWR
jgi:hypothetical protein